MRAELPVTQSFRQRCPAASLSGFVLQVNVYLRSTGVVYILDEPSIGLHPRDNTMLLDSLQRLRDQEYGHRGGTR